MDTYREWGSVTVIDGPDAQHVLSPDFYFVEDNDEFFESDEATNAGVGAMAVNPATGKMYYKSYTGEWLLWGSGSDTPPEVSFAAVTDGGRTTIQATWQEIYDVFNAGRNIVKITDIGTVSDVGINTEVDPPEYWVSVDDISQNIKYFMAYTSDAYPSVTSLSPVM